MTKGVTPPAWPRPHAARALGGWLCDRLLASGATWAVGVTGGSEREGTVTGDGYGHGLLSLSHRGFAVSLSTRASGGSLLTVLRPTLSLALEGLG